MEISGSSKEERVWELRCRKEFEAEAVILALKERVSINIMFIGSKVVPRVNRPLYIKDDFFS